MNELEIKQSIWRGVWGARGSAPTSADFAYWLSVWPGLEARGRELNDPDYAWNRLIGKGAGGADVAAFGPFAAPPSPLHLVPALPPELRGEPPAPPPIEPGLELATRLENLEAAIMSLAMRPDPIYVGESNKLPFFGVITLTLRAKDPQT